MNVPNFKFTYCLPGGDLFVLALCTAVLLRYRLGYSGERSTIGRRAGNSFGSLRSCGYCSTRVNGYVFRSEDIEGLRGSLQRFLDEVNDRASMRSAASAQGQAVSAEASALYMINASIIWLANQT